MGIYATFNYNSVLSCRAVLLIPGIKYWPSNYLNHWQTLSHKAIYIFIMNTTPQVEVKQN